MYILKATFFFYILYEVHFAQFTGPQAAEEEELVGHILEPHGPPDAAGALRHAFPSGAPAECHDFKHPSRSQKQSSVQRV